MSLRQRQLAPSVGDTVSLRQHRQRQRLRNTLLVRAEADVAQQAAAIEKTGPDFKPLRDVQAIMDVLPHRFPFLLVDRVIEMEHEKYAVGYKNVTINDNFFPGHFPQRAIMPGVLQVEAMAQLGGLIMIDPSSEAAKNNFFFGGVDNCKWRRPVVPGDCLMMRVELVKYNKRYGFAKMRGTCHVGANLVCEADLNLVMGK
ncbi:hypothetical protein ABBQ32_001021 [Trebouxia sp. C0010 RCD-2024]